MNGAQGDDSCNNNFPSSSFRLNPKAPPFQCSRTDNRQDCEPNGGAVRKRNNNKQWSNWRRYEPQRRYGSGRITGGSNRNDENFDYTRENYNKNNHYTSYKYSNNNINNNNRSNNTYKNWRKENEKKELDTASQRERLEHMLYERTLECLVCCEQIKNSDKIWSCDQCFLILHLNCTLAWVKSSQIEGGGWRCPACQNVTQEIPKTYICFCGKTIEPRSIPGITPHSCGDICMKIGRLCNHKCMILCHPGPCPDCNVMVSKKCGCNATQQMVKCSIDVEVVCDGICNKFLNCGLHKCQKNCHQGSCEDCSIILHQICFCKRDTREIPCTIDNSGVNRYSCGNECGKLLSCGNHFCKKSCHDGDCDKCLRDIELIKTCPCGKSSLIETRTSCLDPIPCCDKVCGKILSCGQPSMPHVCTAKCHERSCPPCPLNTMVRCRCGHMDKEIPCFEMNTKADDARCEKKCIKKRLCGKHRCNQRCCIEVEHVCPLPCNHMLPCGKHRCERTCHSGRCPPCMETSFEELYCECGSNVIFPPVPCGTKPPVCYKPCSRQRECGHDVNHTCHTGPCPPCTILTKRWCYGKHEQRSAIPCHQGNFSCGLPCGKPLPCGRHKCIKPCHLGDCPLPCNQPCTIKRYLCNHPCNAPCHESSCPDTPCKMVVSVTCQCGHLKATRNCIDLIDEYKELEIANLKEKMFDLMKNQTVDISDINKFKKPFTFKTLECTEECRVLERNRRLAIGLQIKNPDLNQKLTPRYSDFMRNWAKKDPTFCQTVHNRLTELVQLAKQSKQKSRSYSFQSMNRDKRTFIHEYCEHFGCESAAYDAEPNRNVVATAVKDKSWLPSMSLLEVIQRENGQRKVPGPVLNKSTINGFNSTGSNGGAYGITKSESVSLKSFKRPTTPPGEKIDYFDNPPI